MADAVSVLYALAYDWHHDRDLLSTLGVAGKDMDRFDRALRLTGPGAVGPGRAGRDRRSQVKAMGGEVAQDDR